jgi:acyl-CoA thioester hydrolase
VAERNVHEGEASGPASIRLQRRIEWWDTDASGYYHNTAISRLLETAETLLLARLGILHEVYHRLPRVRLEIDFLRPLAFHDLVDAEFRVGAVGNSSVTYGMDVKRAGELCARAKAVAVLLDRAGGKPVPWADEHRNSLLSGGPQHPELLDGSDGSARRID